jgi:hypothetical protein
MFSPVFFIALIAALLLTGIAWYAALVYYPSFTYWQKEAIPLRGPLVHNRGFLLMFPLMSLELLTSFAVVIFSVKVLSADTPGGDSFLMMNGIAFFMLLAIWFISLALMRPARKQFFKQPDGKVHLQLIRIQYVRTGLWTLRAILMVLSVVQKA